MISTRVRGRTAVVTVGVGSGTGARAAAIAGGIATRNTAPRSGSLVNPSSPPSARTIPRLIESPSPVPLPIGLVVKNGSNNRPWISRAIPRPVSAISMIAQPAPSVRVEIEIVWSSVCPSGIASQALTSRLRKTCASVAWFAITEGNGL